MRKSLVWVGLGVMLTGLIIGPFFINKIVVSNRESKRLDMETAFAEDGIVTGTRTVYSLRKSVFGMNVGTEEVLYLKVGMAEYEISAYMLDKVDKGDHVKVSGKRGVIEGLEILK